MIKEQILDHVRQKWIEDFGSLSSSDKRDGSFFMGFLQYALKDFQPKDKKKEKIKIILEKPPKIEGIIKASDVRIYRNYLGMNRIDFSKNCNVNEITIERAERKGRVNNVTLMKITAFLKDKI